MKLFNLFGSKTPAPRDPYWEFNNEKHFRPRLPKGDFFKLKGFDFGWFVLEPLSKFVQNKEQEIERGKSLSYGQKALYYWWYLDAQVTNGGFVQFYYNGYGPYVPTIIKGLEHIGDTEMAKLVEKADGIYQKNRALMEKAQETELFGSDLYEKLDGLTLLDKQYYDKNQDTMAFIEKYVRKNPNHICLDEDGNEFDLTFTGQCQTFYDDTKVKEEFTLRAGVLHGTFNSFYENGNPREKSGYLNGEPTGEQEVFYESGTLKQRVVKNEVDKVFIHHWFFENGQQSKLETKAIATGKKFGESKEWYDNGQLKEQSTFIDNSNRTGKWLKFWKDGSKKLEAEFKDGKVYFENYWAENGTQTLVNGTGIYTNEMRSLNRVTIYETAYENYLRNGTSRTIRKGIVSLEQEFKDGKEHGISRNYYANGNLKEETLYDNGKQISRKNFPMFQNPLVKTTILCEMKAEWLTNRKLDIPDTHPTLLNQKELEAAFKVATTVFDGYSQDHELSYNYFVSIDENGHPTQFDFLMADNGFLKNEVESSMAKMLFNPAQKNGKNVASYLIIKHKFKLAE